MGSFDRGGLPATGFSLVGGVENKMDRDIEGVSKNKPENEWGRRQTAENL